MEISNTSAQWPRLYIEILVWVKEAWEGGGEDVLGPGFPYSIALRPRARSNEGLLITLLLNGTDRVSLEERIDALLVRPGEARLSLYRHGESRSALGVGGTTRR